MHLVGVRNCSAGLIGRLGVAAGFAMAVVIYTAGLRQPPLAAWPPLRPPLEWLSLTYDSRQSWRKGREEDAIVAAG
jgi:hypothetical protein